MQGLGKVTNQGVDEPRDNFSGITLRLKEKEVRFVPLKKFFIRISCSQISPLWVEDGMLAKAE